MASTWGLSWGQSWGSSWGALTSTPAPVLISGGGGGINPFGLHFSFPRRLEIGRAHV